MTLGMTELLIVGAIAALGVAFAFILARWIRLRPVGDSSLQETSELVGGAAIRYLKRHERVVSALILLLAAVILVVYGLAYQASWVTVHAPRVLGIWFSISIVLGAGLALAAVRVVAWVSRHAVARVADGARRSLDEALQLALRAGAVGGVVVVALSVLGFGLLFGVACNYLADGSEESLLRMPVLMSGYVLGVGVVALLGQLGGGVFGKVADLGADIAGKLEAELSEDSSENPAAVTDLVGDIVGNGAGRVLSVFTASVTETFGTTLLAALLYRESTEGPRAMALMLFPLVMRTFGVLSSWFGVMVVRTDDTEMPIRALARGLYVTTLLFVVSAFGSAKWLLGEHWWRFGLCVAIGAVASLGLLVAVQYYSDQRFRPVRALAETGRSGASLVTLRGMVTAVEGCLVVLVVVTVAGVAAYMLGRETQLVFGGIFGLAIAAGGMLGSVPYILAMDGMGCIGDAADGVIQMTVGKERPDVRARTRILDAVGVTAKGFTAVLTWTVSTMACFTLAAMFMVQVTGTTVPVAEEAAVDEPRAIVFLGAVLGLILVMSFIWIATKRLVSSARDFLDEVRGQLGITREVGLSKVRDEQLSDVDSDPTSPRGDTSDRATDATQTIQLGCVETMSRIALRGMLLPAVLGVAVPICFVVILRLAASADRVGSFAEAIVALLLVATIAGAVSSLLFTNAGSAWDNAKKYIETGAHGGCYAGDSASRAVVVASDARSDLKKNPVYVAAVIADTLGDPLKGAIAPATQALLTTLATLAILFLPFFL